MRGAIWGLAAFIFFAGVALAEAEFGGYIRFDAYFPTTDINKDIPKVGSTLQLKAQGSVGSAASFFGAVNVGENDVLRKPEPGVSLVEAYSTLYIGPVDLRVGKQLIAWGKADAINPTDNINPRDYTVISSEPEDQKMGVGALRTTWYIDNFCVEGVWVPISRPSNTPIPTMKVTQTVPFLQKTISAEIVNDPVLPPENLIKGGEVALKLAGTLGPADASLSYYAGFDHTPDLKVRKSVTEQTIDYRIVPKYNRLRVVGGDFAWPIGGWDLRGEGAYFVTEDAEGDNPTVKNPWIQYVLGVGRSFFDDTLNASVQFIRSIIIDYRKPSDYESAFDRMLAKEFDKFNGQIDPIQNSLFARVGYSTLNDTLRPEILAIYEIEGRDYLLQPKLSYAFADGVNASIGAIVYGSFREKDDEKKGAYPFGRMDAEDRAFLEVKYSF
ncbi:MAG: DUF1302 family protein [bacterium]